MDREQAAQLAKGLRKVGRTFDRTAAAMREIDQVDRDALVEPLAKACAIVFGRLHDIYAQYPELAPPAKPPRINSELTWSEVTLPSSVTEDQLDEVILSLLTARARKVLMLVSKAKARFDELGWAISYEMTAARLQVLSDLGRIESEGDLRYWGNSEVRLKD